MVKILVLNIHDGGDKILRVYLPPDFEQAQKDYEMLEKAVDNTGDRDCEVIDCELFAGKTVSHAILLGKYIKYVMDCEGTDYITYQDSRYKSEVEFSHEEWQILEEISKRCNYEENEDK